LPASLTAIESWRQSRFGTLDNSGDGANHADPDFDGITNLMEYATSGDPKHFNPSPATGSKLDGILQLTFDRTADSTLLYEVQGSSDLQTWTSVASSSGSSNVAGPITFPDVPPPTASRRFLRLRVSVP